MERLFALSNIQIEQEVLVFNGNELILELIYDFIHLVETSHFQRWKNEISVLVCSNDTEAFGSFSDAILSMMENYFSNKIDLDWYTSIKSIFSIHSIEQDDYRKSLRKVDSIAMIIT